MIDDDLKKALILGLALSQDSYQEEEIEKNPLNRRVFSFLHPI